MNTFKGVAFVIQSAFILNEQKYFPLNLAKQLKKIHNFQKEMNYKNGYFP